MNATFDAGLTREEVPIYPDNFTRATNDALFAPELYRSYDYGDTWEDIRQNIPFLNSFFIEFKTVYHHGGRVELYDLDGRLILGRSFNNNDEVFRIETDYRIQPGIYILKIINGEECYSSKLLKSP